MADLNDNALHNLAAIMTPASIQALVDAAGPPQPAQPVPAVPHLAQGQFYGVVSPDGGLQVFNNQAEADAAVIGVRGATRRAFGDAWSARRYVAQHALVSIPRNLSTQYRLYSRMQESITTAGNVFTAFTGSPLLALPENQGQNMPSPTVSFTPLNFLPFVPTPSSLRANVGGCRVEIVFNNFPSRVDAHNINTHDLSFRGVPGVVPAGPTIPYGPVRTSGINLGTEYIGENTITRVVPDSIIQVGDGTIIPPVLDHVPGMLVAPLAPVPRLPDVYFWVILQGVAVGIFKGTARNVRELLPAGLSVAKAFLTLEEASAFLYEQLDSGFSLTELTEASDADASLHAALGDARREALAQGDMEQARLATTLQTIINPPFVPAV
ncbi:hypothetical protein PENSPDRAFT_694635 [Peniophora sp. CONT]|nr:hypothetical protein PENSPDRAFT_694635 [Peniophora sp. CONT]